jgi:F-type H+-transporting ATPase subunit b
VLLWQLLVIQVVTFVVLAFLLHQFLYRQMTRSLGRLQQLYHENREREEALKRRREETEQELRATMARHQEELGRLRAESEAATHEMREEILAQAKEEGRRIVADAEARRERMRASLMSEMEDKAVGLASDILGRVLTGPLAQAIHHDLIDELIDEVGRADGQRLELVADVVDVTAAFPLSPAQKERLHAIFSSTTGRDITITETIDAALGAGMLVRFGDVIMDGSLNNKVRGMLTYVRENLSR